MCFVDSSLFFSHFILFLAIALSIYGFWLPFGILKLFIRKVTWKKVETGTLKGGRKALRSHSWQRFPSKFVFVLLKHIHVFFNCGTYAEWKVKIRCSVHLLQFVCRRAHVLFTLFVFVYVQWCSTHLVCCAFVLFFFVLCTLCCQLLWIFQFWLIVRYSRTFVLSKLKHLEYHKLMPANWILNLHICVLFDEIKSTDIHVQSIDRKLQPWTLKSW
jgi:hypothetical protein